MSLFYCFASAFYWLCGTIYISGSQLLPFLGGLAAAAILSGLLRLLMELVVDRTIQISLGVCAVGYGNLNQRVIRVTRNAVLRLSESGSGVIRVEIQEPDGDVPVIVAGAPVELRGDIDTAVRQGLHQERDDRQTGDDANG
jgi:hypothetical protein